MKSKNFSKTFAVESSPSEVFTAITKVHKWWGKGIKGKSDKEGDSFLYKHKELHISEQTVIEFVPNKKLVWKVSNSQINFVKNKSEWDNTEIIFEIEKSGKKTNVTMTHHGLNPKLACFEDCSGGWSQYFGESLKKLIETGEGDPDPASFSK